MAKRGARSWLILGILTALILYIAAQLIPVFFRGYQTQTAVTSTLADAVPARGIAVRREQALESAGGVLNYLAEDGKRVSSGAAVAEVFSGQAQAQSWALKTRLDAHLEMLEQSQTQDLAGGMDVDQLIRQQQDGLIELLSLLDGGYYSGLEEAKNNLTMVANRLAEASGQTLDLSSQIAQVTALRDAAAAAAGTVQYLYAPGQGGYYSSMTDGMEGTLNPDTAAAMSREELLSLVDGSQVQLTRGAGKVISDYEWYYYCFVDASAAERFISEDKQIEVEIDFDYTDATEIPATVVRVEEDANGGPALVVLKCDYINDETVNLRTETAQISFARYEGVCIEQSAVHIVTDEEGNQVTGVYVKYGNTVEFKRIDPIFENDHYVIVPAKTRIGSDENSMKNEVLLYDEIIVSGKDLYDGKLL